MRSHFVVAVAVAASERDPCLALVGAATRPP